MKTDQLVLALAGDLAPVNPRRVSQRFFGLLAAAAALSFLAMLVALGPRADWRGAMQLPMFWMKLAFPASIAVAALVVLRRLCYPGLRPGRAWVALLVPVAIVWAMALVRLVQAPAGDRMPMVMGAAGWLCPVAITVLSVPAFVLALRAARGLAPTRLRLAGAAAGLFAGSAAAFAYALACPEMQAPYLAVWYVLGMLVPAAVGAVAGERVLRW